MASKLRATILAAKDIKSELVTVPEWGGVTIEVRGLTAAQQVECSNRSTVIKKGPDGDDVTSQDSASLTQFMVLESVFDPETGERVLENTDADALWQKSAIVLNRLAAIVMRLNGMTKQEDAAMEKNSDATTSGAGASA